MSQNTTQSESVRRLFHGKNFGFLATLAPDGSPQVTRSWLDTYGRHVIINTALERKVQERFTGPRVAISVADRSSPYNMVSVRGRAVEQTNISTRRQKSIWALTGNRAARREKKETSEDKT